MRSESKHISVELLVDRAEGALLDSAQLVEISDHLTNCVQCTEQARFFQLFFEQVAQRLLEESPRDAAVRAMSLYASRATAAPRSLAQRILGILAFDDWDPAFAVNERYVASDSRQLLYRAEEHDVDLRIAPDGDGWTVTGQLLGECGAGKVAIVSEVFQSETALNENCEFLLARVPAGRYALRVSFDRIAIEIEGLIID